MTVKVAIACDHGGVELKAYLQEAIFQVSDLEWVDLGTNSQESVDYPDYGRRLAEAIESRKAHFGVAICGTGIGISIACNRNLKVRAALCTDVTMARLARQHNDANVICLGARMTADVLAKELVEVFLKTKFEGGRHTARVNKLG